MKKIFLLFSLSLSFTAFAQQGALEIHGNFEDDQHCSAQIRNLGCGDPADKSFLTCVNRKISELEPKCQDYHLDEMDRELDRQDSKN